MTANSYHIFDMSNRYRYNKLSHNFDPIGTAVDSDELCAFFRVRNWDRSEYQWFSSDFPDEGVKLYQVYDAMVAAKFIGRLEEATWICRKLAQWERNEEYYIVDFTESDRVLRQNGLDAFSARFPPELHRNGWWSAPDLFSNWSNIDLIDFSWIRFALVHESCLALVDDLPLIRWFDVKAILESPDPRVLASTIPSRDVSTIPDHVGDCQFTLTS